MYTNNNNFVATAAVGSTAPLLTGERPSLGNSFGIQFKHAFLTSLSTQLENPLNARSVNKTNAKQQMGKGKEVFAIFMRLGTLVKSIHIKDQGVINRDGAIQKRVSGVIRYEKHNFRFQDQLFFLNS
uniref:Uncharacterized protein n=1 Tax=Glossina pallidipes TaxID=7398 RepID=A0A1A9ZQ84_GLOPL